MIAAATGTISSSTRSNQVATQRYSSNLAVPSLPAGVSDVGGLQSPVRFQVESGPHSRTSRYRRSDEADLRRAKRIFLGVGSIAVIRCLEPIFSLDDGVGGRVATALPSPLEMRRSSIEGLSTKGSTPGGEIFRWDPRNQSRQAGDSDTDLRPYIAREIDWERLG